MRLTAAHVASLLYTRYIAYAIQVNKNNLFWRTEYVYLTYVNMYSKEWILKRNYFIYQFGYRYSLNYLVIKDMPTKL